MNLKVTPNFSDNKNFKDNWNLKFLECCESSNIVGGNTGWQPLYFLSEDDFSWSYIKSHSYGEYIFDWAWADLYQRFGMNYYPKLIHALPFTPVNAQKIYSAHKKNHINAVFDFYMTQEVLTSDHWLFIKEEEVHSFEDSEYFLQKTLQYHFKNNYESFDDYLNTMKMRKRKNIKRERNTVDNYGITISKKDISEISDDELKEIYALYLTTIDKKHSMAYLNQTFFLNLKNYMKDEVFFFLAHGNERLMAMSMFIKSTDTLYGRYWGIDPVFEKTYSYLHFEMCYYLGIEYCIKHKIPLFEAGAQGEQKLLRGFEPVIINSFHHIKNQQLAKVIQNHIEIMNKKIIEEQQRLREFLPFKE